MCAECVLPEDSGLTALHTASSLEALQTTLRDNRELLEASSHNGLTPLAYMITTRQFKMARVLLRAGAKLSDRRDYQGFTALNLLVLETRDMHAALLREALEQCTGTETFQHGVSLLDGAVLFRRHGAVMALVEMLPISKGKAARALREVWDPVIRGLQRLKKVGRFPLELRRFLNVPRTLCVAPPETSPAPEPSPPSDDPECPAKRAKLS